MSNGEIRPVCPHARAVQGVTPGDSGVICGAMERDQARADRILEGAPVGVYVKAREDPSTLFNFCCGTAPPSPHPDQVVAHHTSCPIFAADREIADAERMYAMDTSGARPKGFTQELFDESEALEAWTRDTPRKELTP